MFFFSSVVLAPCLSFLPVPLEQSPLNHVPKLRSLHNSHASLLPFPRQLQEELIPQVRTLIRWGFLRVESDQE